MNQKESLRYDIIKKLIDQKINGTEASVRINLSIRQTKRLKAMVKKYGLRGIIHGGRNRESNRKTKTETINEIKKYIQEKYYDFGPTFAREKLKENHNIEIGTETLRQIMIKEGLWKSKSRRKSGRHKSWRARKEYFGEMEQFDGCYHIWFGKKESCLLLSVDDAKGEITHAKFDYNESTAAVFKFWLEYFSRNGLPVSIYLDKFSTYKINHPAAVDNQDLMTQFERAMNQIGVQPITAHSPEAKGRVERMFETLQDRLVKELRLAGITTITEANKFLEEYIPKFNAKFAVVPQKNKNLHREINKDLKEKLPQIFSIQNERKVHNDYTVMFENQYFQLEQEQPTTVYKKDSVIIEKHLGGTVKINLKGHYLSYHVLPARPQKQIDVKLLAITGRKQSGWKPPVNHPWRNFVFSNKSKVEKIEA
ncbi:ISNCY family transposase [Patescibacteria group bacterium]|nr:ISNCY family transposase [Patescibacteria group bacterium]MBU4455109.1 ISNCY family transposase [Patescibacteria group bacterium]